MHKFEEFFLYNNQYTIIVHPDFRAGSSKICKHGSQQAQEAFRDTLFKIIHIFLPYLIKRRALIMIWLE